MKHIGLTILSIITCVNLLAQDKSSDFLFFLKVDSNYVMVDNNFGNFFCKKFTENYWIELRS